LFIVILCLDKINGAYVLQPESISADRPVYKQREAGLFLWFHQGRGAWVISDFVGHAVPYAFAEDPCQHPGECFNNRHLSLLALPFRLTRCAAQF
tara:strand:+ start:423 stop:707 length:285 start_codon:yes stop_codon:yes gene_type:complete